MHDQQKDAYDEEERLEYNLDPFAVHSGWFTLKDRDETEQGPSNAVYTETIMPWCLTTPNKFISVIIRTIMLVMQHVIEVTRR